MGIIFYIPLLAFTSLKFGHYLFVLVLRTFWQVFQLLLIPAIEGFRRSGSNFSKWAEFLKDFAVMPSLSAGQAAASSRHALTQGLNNMLSARGPNALPYNEDVKSVIRQQVLTMLKEYPELPVNSDTFIHNDGRHSNLLQSSGTIPMTYKDVKYNVPITIWLVEAYPRVAPLVFVNPTRDMIIKSHHRCVDTSGNVSIPYLQQWIYPRSNLVDLIRNLSLIFGEDPPLYSRPPSIATQREQAAAQAAVAARPSTQSSIHATNPLHAYGGSGWASPSTGPGSPATQSPSRLGRPPYVVDSSSPGSSSRLNVKAATPEEAFRSNAVIALTERLMRDSKAFSKRMAVEVDDLFNTQVQLNERKVNLDQGFRDLQKERELLEEQLQSYTRNTGVIESWLRENQDDQSELGVDESFQPVDELSRQTLESTAADLAIDDILYSLDRAVQDGSVEWDVYFKAVRQLSREQFYHRATCAKASELLREVQVKRMARRLSDSKLDAAQ